MLTKKIPHDIINELRLERAESQQTSHFDGNRTLTSKQQCNPENS